jgi:hypothetical protein
LAKFDKLFGLGYRFFALRIKHRFNPGDEQTKTFTSLVSKHGFPTVAGMILR